MQKSRHLSRRRFISLTTDVALASTLSVVLNSRVAFARPTRSTITLFDPRFSRAHRLALEMAGAEGLLTINGDPTMLALKLFAAPPADSPRLQGVTTESVPFCLGQLRPRAELRHHRIDRDLFSWTLEERS